MSILIYVLGESDTSTRDFGIYPANSRRCQAIRQATAVQNDMTLTVSGLVPALF